MAHSTTYILLAASISSSCGTHDRGNPHNRAEYASVVAALHHALNIEQVATQKRLACVEAPAGTMSIVPLLNGVEARR